MQEGFVLDFTYGNRLVSRWIAGKPEKSFLGIIKISKKEQYSIQTYRCSGCGFLESYANNFRHDPT